MLKIHKSKSHTCIYTQWFTDQIKNLQRIKTNFFNKTKIFKYNNLQSENNQTKKKKKSKLTFPHLHTFIFRNLLYQKNFFAAASCWLLYMM